MSVNKLVCVCRGHIYSLHFVSLCFFIGIKNNVGPLGLEQTIFTYSIFIASEILKDRSFYYLLHSLDSLFKGLYYSKTLGLPCNFRDVEGIIQRALHAHQLNYFLPSHRNKL